MTSTKPRAKARTTYTLIADMLERGAYQHDELKQLATLIADRSLCLSVAVCTIFLGYENSGTLRVQLCTSGRVGGGYARQQDYLLKVKELVECVAYAKAQGTLPAATNHLTTLALETARKALATSQ